MKNFAYILLAVIILTGAGCSQSQEGAQSQPQTNNAGGLAVAPTQAAENTAKAYSLADIGMHSKEGDCWLAIDGKVYDVSSYTPKHPGGDKILNGCGKDASQMFASVKKHEGFARELLKDFEIGELK